MLTVGTFAPFTYGKGLSKKARNETGSVPVFGSNGIIGYHDKPLTKGPTIIIGRKGTVGAVHYSAVPCWPIDTTFYITESNSQKLRFKYYLLQSLGLNLMNSDSAVPGLNREAAHAIRISVPSEMEQQFISSFLGDLDDKIELNRMTNETLEEMARALFKSWFVDFDPVRAKIDGRWQPGQSLPGLPAELYDLFPDQFVPTELGNIPEGWKLMPLSKVVDVNPKYSLKKGTSVPYLSMSNMPTYGHVPIKIIDRQFRSGMKFKNGDTLVARITPCLENGKTAFVGFLDDEEIGWGSTEFIVMRSKHPLPKEYAYCLARSNRFREFAIRNMTGTSGRQRVSANSLAYYQIPIPTSSEILELFGLHIKPLFEFAQNSVEESNTLSELRDTLLPKLLSGEIRVDNLEQPI